MTKVYYSHFASTYGQGNYDTSVYSADPATTTSTGTATNQTGTLTNTGFGVLVAVTLACLIIFSALAVRFVRKKRNVHPATSEEA